MAKFEATIHAEIEIISGPDITDLHALRWLCGTRSPLDGGFATFTYEACPIHDQPDECDCPDTGDPWTRVHVTIQAADFA